MFDKLSNTIKIIICVLSFLPFGLQALSDSKSKSPAHTVIESYYQLSESGDYEPLMMLFSPEMEIKMTWRYGQGYPDETMTLKASEWFDLPGDDAAKVPDEWAEDYEELSRSQAVLTVTEEEQGFKVQGSQTVEYKASFGEGEASVVNDFILQEKNGVLKITPRQQNLWVISGSGSLPSV